MRTFLFLFSVLLFMTFNIDAQPMKTTTLLNNLNPYQKLIVDLEEQERSLLNNDATFSGFSKRVRLAYDFIILSLKKQTEEEKGELYLEVKFERRGEKIVLSKVYCANHDRSKAIENFIKSNSELHNTPWNTEELENYTNTKLNNQYLSIADSIASIAIHQSSGDDYRPGYYSAINIIDLGIELEQINHMNSRSIDHKDDYSLRTLKIFIPFEGVQIQTSRFDFLIGNMGINFSDSSSPKNKQCGNEMLQKIKECERDF